MLIMILDEWLFFNRKINFTDHDIPSDNADTSNEKEKYLSP
jgi:hypothetical protein